MGNVLITGISGFIAKHLAHSLTEQGYNIVGLSRTEPNEGTVHSGVRFVRCDITDPHQVLTAVESIQPETVYHLAAHSVLTGTTAAEMLRINVSGTVNVLEACHIVGVPVCVVASSDKQYGTLAIPPYHDDDSTAFLNGGVYELSKSQQDQIARLFAGLYDVPSVRVARLVNIYGPGDTQWTRIIPGTIRRTVRQEAPRITSGKAGESLREYLYVGDAVAALRLLAEDAVVSGNAPYRATEGKLARVAFNVAGGTRMAAGGVIALIQALLRDEFGVSGPEPIVQPGPEGVFEPGGQFNDAQRITELFRRHGGEYAPRSLTEGLRSAIPWYLDHLQADS